MFMSEFYPVGGMYVTNSEMYIALIESIPGAKRYPLFTKPSTHVSASYFNNLRYLRSCFFLESPVDKDKSSFLVLMLCIKVSLLLGPVRSGH